MKKILVIFNLFVYACCYADFVNLDLAGQNIPIEEASTRFSDWFGTGESTFEQFSHETDVYGVQHIAFQQFYRGLKVDNCIIILHASEGIVMSINGDVLKPQNQPHKIRERRVSSTNNQDSISLIHISTDSIDKFYNAYRKETEYGVFYYDVETSELIKSVPRAMNAVAASGYTKYSSNRSFECDYSSNKYYLSNSSKNIKVYRTQMNYNTGTCGAKYDFTSSDNTWSGNYITSVTITGVSNFWWGALVDNYPDLYITITDTDDNLLYISDYKSDVGKERNYPVTFRISDMVRVPENGGYKIKVWDYDPVGDPDLGYTGRLTSNSLGKHSWGDASANVRFYCQITNWHPANDLFWGLNVVYDYYLNVFNRNSFDNNGATIQAYLHSVHSISGIYNEYGTSNIFGNYLTGSDYENAYATGDTSDVTTAYLHFGLGNEFQDTRVGLNTIGHEFTHLICKYRSKGELEYSGESGALNESTADMMALSIEHFAKPETFNWRYGEDHMLDGGCTRDFQNPENGYTPQPDTYGVGPYWVSPQSSSDNGGVHSNSGVSNHWFYLLCDGGSGINGKNNTFTVQAIGIDKAQRILFNALLYYFPPQTTFAQARALTEKTAIQIYGKNSQEHQSVINAWHAVGVGEPYSEDFVLPPGKYVIVANRDKDNDRNWYYMTSDLGTASTKRFQAINTNTENLNNIVTEELEDKYIWELVEDGENWKLKNDSNFITWTSGNSANLAATGKTLTCNMADNAVQVHFNDGSAERYLAMNQTTGNNYFAFYTGSNQIKNLVFLPYKVDTITPAPDCKSIPFTETFASSQGDFTIQNVILPDGLTSIWNWNAQYGMVANAINGSTKYESEAWLISPCIELPTNQECVLTFSHAAKFFPDTDQMTLYLTTDYITEAPGESYWEQLIIPTYPTGTNWNWFESGEIDLSAYKGEHIVVGFRYVSNTNYAPQWEIKNFAITQSGTTPVTPPVESNRYIVLAQRDASSNWFYMTSDLGSASTKRYQAVDAGTNVLANVSNINLADKYYWEIEDNKLKTAAGYSTWTSGNSANINATGKELTIQQQADGTYTFSFADGSDTRYLSLNKTTGNDYFAYYKGTAQVYKLTLVKEGATTPTVIENTSDESFHDSPIRKVIEDGQLYIILPNGTRYTATGVKVK